MDAANALHGAHALDGPSTILAHAYYPPPGGSATGDVHFDQEENWSCMPGSGSVVKHQL